MNILESTIGGNGVAYYINLNERVDRKISAENNIKNAGFQDVQRYPAINWKNLNTNELVFEIDDEYDILSINKYTVALSMTNIVLLKQFLDSIYDFIVIFEDDVFFDENFEKILEKKLKIVPPNWNVLTLGSTPFPLGPIEKTPELINNELHDDIYIVEKFYNLGNSHAIIIKDKETVKYIISKAIPFKYPWNAFIGSLSETINIYNINRLAYQDNFISDLRNFETNYYTIWAQILTVKTLALYAYKYNDDLIKSTEQAFHFISNYVDDIILKGNDFTYDKNFKNKLLLDKDFTITLITFRDYLQTRLAYNLLEMQQLSLYLLNIFFDKYIDNYNYILPKIQKHNVNDIHDITKIYDSYNIDLYDYYSNDNKYKKLVSKKSLFRENDESIWYLYKITGSLVHL